MEVTSIAVNKLSNSMRLYTETCVEFPGLAKIDMIEAVDNLDRAFEAKLEAFHSLYDVSKRKFDYFSHAETATLIMIRNAIHHRNHTLFFSWNYEMHKNNGLTKHHDKEFVLVDHVVNDGAFTARYYYKVDDVLDRIDRKRGSPFLEGKMSDKQKDKLLEQITNDLRFSRVIEDSEKSGYSSEQIYINLVPIFISAMAKIYPAFEEMGVDLSDFDSDVYLRHFGGDISVDFDNYSLNPIHII